MTQQIQNTHVRVRFAPSPTGYLHVGGARTLLFNWLYAKKTGGTLVLRVEDTDRARSTREHEAMILSDIRRLGTDYQEGPIESGEQLGKVGPYRQSERLKIYAQFARQLWDAGKAYPCFCPEELLTQKREAALKLGKNPHYDGTCLRIPADEAKRRVAAGEKSGLRFKVTRGSVVLEDAVRGKIEFGDGMVGDFFITRSPYANEQEIAEGIGMPVYNFCCAIDDHEMGMTHVIRGEDHLSNTARQLMIYHAFGWSVPIFAHIPMVLGADRQKLSKRSGDVSVFEYLEKGFLPEALLNFLSLLGWWPPADAKPASGHPEILSLSELVQYFSLDGLQKAPAVFDLQKLKWMNGQYIKALPLPELARRARPFFEKDAPAVLANGDAAWFERVLSTVRNDCELLSDLPAACWVFNQSKVDITDEARALLADAQAAKVAQTFYSKLRQANQKLELAGIEEIQKGVAQEQGVKGKNLFMPMRAALFGSLKGPDFKAVLELLGREAAVARIEQVGRALQWTGVGGA